MAPDQKKTNKGRGGKKGSTTAAAANKSNKNPQLEKGNRVSAEVRDSEALVSSEDDGDHRQEVSAPTSQPPKPVRRSSWLNDTSVPSIPRPRKGSFASNSVSSPTTSHPSTPSGENGPVLWGPTSGLSRTSGGSFTWGSGIWSNDRKDAPARLSEVLPSPTSLVPPGGTGNSFFGPDAGLNQTSPSREPGANPQIPFAIPLHPTPKTYRSQSYSVGQLEADLTAANMMNSSGVIGGRARHPALQHRPSRPSMLSEMANDGSMLGKVKEVEDDEDEGDSPSSSMHGSFHQSAEAQIEMLTRENAMLRQQQQQQFNTRVRPRAATSSFMANGYPVVPEESDFAVDELDENVDPADYSRRGSQRRLSEFAAPSYRTPIGMDKTKLENPSLKKASLWSSTPGLFGADPSQGRRHSFANMPTRQGSISSVADSVAALDTPVEAPPSQAFGPGFADIPNLSGPNAAYFNPSGSMGNTRQNQATSGTFIGNPTSQPHFRNRSSSPQRHFPRPDQPLYVVLFKCARADIFYVADGTGLVVNPGDLVIVEADRGTDLGTVAKRNVDWQTAKELKEHYAEEQYKWLMMYSQNAAAAQDGSGGLLAAASLPGSAVGGMGPPGQQPAQEPAPGEFRPKMIKRLAQKHEIQALRDKEGQEAKAKRTCMQKVKEHGLNMEILDAEFQMDWKKLTFYYFADAYINFNSLVTDLFKTYKTRIWMSAINPASFSSPTLGIQAPSGIGPGAVGVRGSGGERRQAGSSRDQNGSSYGNNGSGGRGGYRHGNRQQQHAQHTTDRSAPSPIAAPGFPPPNYAFGPGAFNAPRNQSPYMGGLPPSDGFPAGAFAQPTDFHHMRQRFGPGPGNQGPPLPHGQVVSPISPQGDWNAAFQGLSLNTH